MTNQLEGDLAFESLEHHWELNLIRTTEIDPNLIPRVAFILAQDELHGTDARTPAQIELMGLAVDSRTKAR
ncbi:hypothetical protein NG799_27710 [Laspinema sp. D1]|uniref:Uncharacterized protein n=1 Tax=Laspinema palackyanum D2a TaxID=2953684 RepID=A0ABT2MZB8_9CYAN|nr:hypothetical protein [Laspinema sp. D2a]